MPIDKIDFDLIEEKDLQELVIAQVPEGIRLDFKRTNYGKSDSDKRELLKDVSALANAHGGHLILGVDENQGVAAQVIGIDIDADAEISRMGQIIRNAIEPSIPGIRMRFIPLESGYKVLLLRVPQSWNPPHRVTAKGINKFFVRNSAGVHEPDVEELRALFNQSASALEKANRFRKDRIRSVIEDNGPRPLAGGGRLFFHIIPTAAFSGLQLDVELIHKHHTAFEPLGASGKTSRFNFYGFINERGGEQNHGYTQIFRHGVLEATKAGIIDKIKGRLIVYSLHLEKCIFAQLSHYIDGLRDIGVPPPLVVMLTFEGVLNAHYAIKPNHFGDDYEYPLPKTVINLPECIIEEYGSVLDYHNAVRPAFDALWNAIGYSKSQFFDENGRWVGRQNR